TVTWREAGSIRLCLLTADMQNRRIINRHFAEAGVTVEPSLESNSMIVLFSHVRTGRWSSIMPKNIAKSFGFPEGISIVSLVDPDPHHTVGLVATHREPFTPLVSALLHEARTLAEKGMD